MKMEQRALAMLLVLLKHQQNSEAQPEPGGMKVSEIVSRLHGTTGRHYHDSEIERLVKEVNGWGEDIPLTLIEEVPGRRPKEYRLNGHLEPGVWNGLASLAFAMSLVKFAESEFKSGEHDSIGNFQNMVMLLFGLRNQTVLRIRYEVEEGEKTISFLAKSLQFRGGWYVVGKTIAGERRTEIALRKIQSVERD
jgi:hypothetical protein